MRKELMRTPEGRDALMDSLFTAWNKCAPKGDRTMGWEDIKKMEAEFAPIHDKSFGGHWIWDAATAKAAFEFTTHIFGEGERISFP